MLNVVYCQLLLQYLCKNRIYMQAAQAAVFSKIKHISIQNNVVFFIKCSYWMNRVNPQSVKDNKEVIKAFKIDSTSLCV